MTTPAAEKLYLAQHEAQLEGRGWAIYNPHNKPIDELPSIYGFNNGGRPGCYEAILVSDNGVCLGGHTCSHEGYMPHDLGILEGTRQDRHEVFREHYPGGYKMVWVPTSELKSHAGLNAAIEEAKLARLDGEGKS